QSAAAAARGSHSESGRDRQGVRETGANRFSRRRRSACPAGRRGAKRQPRLDGRRESGPQRAARSSARDRRELSAAQVERKLPRSPGPARRNGESHCRRSTGLQRNGQLVQRVHSPLSASDHGEGTRQETAVLFRAANARGGRGAPCRFLEMTVRLTHVTRVQTRKRRAAAKPAAAKRSEERRVGKGGKTRRVRVK